MGLDGDSGSVVTESSEILLAPSPRVLLLLAVLARRTGDQARLVASFEWLGQRIGPLVTLVLAVSGIWMVLRSGARTFADPLAGFWLMTVWP